MTRDTFLLVLPVLVVAVVALAHGIGALERRRRKHEEGSWESEQVEMFLRCVDDPEYSFKGYEWADFIDATD